jgi:hypothetical protein
MEFFHMHCLFIHILSPPESSEIEGGACACEFHYSEQRRRSAACDLMSRRTQQNQNRTHRESRGALLLNSTPWQNHWCGENEAGMLHSAMRTRFQFANSIMDEHRPYYPCKCTIPSIVASGYTHSTAPKRSQLDQGWREGASHLQVLIAQAPCFVSLLRTENLC